MSFPKTVNQMGSFGEKRKKMFFRFCRPILDIFGFPLLIYCEDQRGLCLFQIKLSLFASFDCFLECYSTNTELPRKELDTTNVT